MAINSLIFLAAAYEFVIEKALYSILTYFTATQVSGYVVDGFEQYTALTVISGKSKEIKSLIVEEHGKAISVYKGEKGYLPKSFETFEDCDILMTIVTRLEIQKIRKSVIELDPTAFIYITKIKEVNGGVIKKIRNH